MVKRGPEAIFGVAKGVVRTRVGFTEGSYEEGGKKKSYCTEAIQIAYDSSKTSFSDLLSLFWRFDTKFKFIKFRK